MFCQQDRAILCRECDVSIHKVNEHTQKHNRFLLTGVKISANSSLYSSSESPSATSSTTNQDSVTNLNKSQICTEKPLPFPVSVSDSQQVSVAANIGESSYTSSISEYLEMLPGWHVEEFLNSSTIPTNGFCKVCILCSFSSCISIFNWSCEGEPDIIDKIIVNVIKISYIRAVKTVSRKNTD